MFWLPLGDGGEDEDGDEGDVSEGAERLRGAYTDGTVTTTLSKSRKASIRERLSTSNYVRTKEGLIDPRQVLNSQSVFTVIEVRAKIFQTGLLLLASHPKRSSTTGNTIKGHRRCVVEINIVETMVVLFISKDVNGRAF